MAFWLRAMPDSPAAWISRAVSSRCGLRGLSLRSGGCCRLRDPVLPGIVLSFSYFRPPRLRCEQNNFVNMTTCVIFREYICARRLFMLLTYRGVVQPWHCDL